MFRAKQVQVTKAYWELWVPDEQNYEYNFKLSIYIFL